MSKKDPLPPELQQVMSFLINYTAAPKTIRDEKFIELGKAIALLDAYAETLAARERWSSIETAPNDGTPISVPATMRYLPYKPGRKRQMKAHGRWQVWDGYGWEDSPDDPEIWQPLLQSGEKI